MTTENLGTPDTTTHPAQKTAPISASLGAPALAPYAATASPATAVGKIRSTGVCMLLMLVTFGIYGYVYFYKTHEEMKRHTGAGIGGALAVVLTFFVGVAMPFITSSEVGGLYERRAQKRPVSAATGLWYLPGMLILVGPFIWFIKTNGALNAYWRSLGAH